MANDSDRSTTFIDAKRRGFLQGATLAGAAAATGVGVAAPLPEPVVDGVEPKRDAGYRETDHVRAYYAAARN